MSICKPLTIVMLIFATLLPKGGKAQDTHKANFPSFVLVHLSSEQNRTNALIKAKRYADLEVFRRETFEVAMAMVNDFKDHFSFCPVYFYFDTNFAAIMDRKFDGVLMNADFSPATNVPLNDSSKDYLIVHHGFPEWQTKKRKWDTTKSSGMGGKPNGRGLIINDYKMRQLSYIYWLDYDFFNYKKNGKVNKYKYQSKIFDLEYFPCASEFNRRLKERRKKQINRENSDS